MHLLLVYSMCRWHWRVRRLLDHLTWLQHSNTFCIMITWGIRPPKLSLLTRQCHLHQRCILTTSASSLLASEAITASIYSVPRFEFRAHLAYTFDLHMYIYACTGTCMWYIGINVCHTRRTCTDIIHIAHYSWHMHIAHWHCTLAYAHCTLTYAHCTLAYAHSVDDCTIM